MVNERIERLRASVRRLIDRMSTSSRVVPFRRSQTNLDGVMGVRATNDATRSRTRVRTATFSRAPGRTIDWPGPVPSSWRERNPED